MNAIVDAWQGNKNDRVVFLKWLITAYGNNLLKLVERLTNERKLENNNE